jgi:hypothetical protein
MAAVTELKWPWLAATLAVLVVGLLLLWLRRPRAPRDAVLVAHTDRLKRVPRYRSLTRRQLAVTALRSAAALVLIAGAVLLAARPVEVVVTKPDRSARDIQLCLDVSPSMYEWNRQIIGEFRELVDQLGGERIGLTIFDASSVTVFPLTDDYEFMGERLDEAEAAFEDGGYDYFVGTLPIKRRGDDLVPVVRRASQIGDGLVSCLQRFDDLEDDERGRAVVLASDNEPAGPPLFDLDEAAGKALRENVVVYGIGPPDLVENPTAADAFDEAAASTGGTLSLLQEDTNVDDVVDGIQQLERARLDKAPTATEVDDPEAAVGLAAAGLTLLVLASFLRRRS